MLASLLAAGMPLGAQNLGSEYRLKRVIPVEGRQGVAADSNFYYVSGSTALYKYDKQGRLAAKNERPFEGLPLAANHIGDIDVWDGEIYAGIDRPAFVPGRADHFGRRVAVGDILYFPGVLARYEQAQFLGRERVLAADAHAVGVVDALVVIRAAGDGGIDVESREVENIDRVGAHRDFIRGGSVFAPGVILVVSADGVLAQRDGHTRFDQFTSR